MPEVKKLVEVAFPVDSPPKSGTKRSAPHKWHPETCAAVSRNYN